ncbi:MAG: prolipoprotein diacylglyceryl transferase [Deltaproteobacteria bacterium]|nr:prolipoprotein diacylglyceryl transferase [Deltaproteobacteria bacterium]
MWPTLYEIQLPQGGTIGLHTYGLMILVAFSVAFSLIHQRSRQVGIHPDRLVGVYIAAAFGGILGARLLYAIAVEPQRILADPSALFSLGGLAYYGGVIGGAIAVLAVGAWMRIPGWKFADIAAPALVLGQGIGRMGCFFAGCCHGAAAPAVSGAAALLPDGLLLGQIYLGSSFPYLTTEFHPGGVTRAELMNVPLYPTQLWAVAGGLGLAALLALMWRHRRFDGQIAATMLILQPLYRIAIEIFRADNRGYALAWETSSEWALYLPGIAQAGAQLQSGGAAVQVGVTTSQGIGLVMIVVGAALYVFRWRAGVGEEIPVD